MSGPFLLLDVTVVEFWWPAVIVEMLVGSGGG